MSIIKKTTKYKYMHKKLDKLRYMIWKAIINQTKLNNTIETNIYMHVSLNENFLAIN